MWMFLQESKSGVDEKFVKSLWPSESMQFMAVDSEGSVGGLLCVWNPNVFKITKCCSSRNFVLLSGMYNQSFDCVIVNIYAPNDGRKRGQLWELLLRLKPYFRKPWSVGGDLNKVRF